MLALRAAARRAAAAAAAAQVRHTAGEWGKGATPSPSSLQAPQGAARARGRAALADGATRRRGVARCAGCRARARRAGRASRVPWRAWRAVKQNSDWAFRAPTCGVPKRAAAPFTPVASVACERSLVPALTRCWPRFTCSALSRLGVCSFVVCARGLVCCRAPGSERGGVQAPGQAHHVAFHHERVAGGGGPGDGRHSGAREVAPMEGAGAQSTRKGCLWA